MKLGWILRMKNVWDLWRNEQWRSKCEFISFEMKRESSYGQGGCDYFTVPDMCKLFCFWVTVDFTIIAFGRFCFADLNRTHYTFICWCVLVHRIKSIAIINNDKKLNKKLNQTIK